MSTERPTFRSRSGVCTCPLVDGGFNAACSQHGTLPYAPEGVGPSGVVYITIGNSDDKLSQADWSSYVAAVDRTFEAAVRFEGARVHGRWYSLPHEPWQNVCWCAEWHADLGHVVEALKRGLAGIARAYGQDSIAWAEAPVTEFIGATT